MASTDRLTTPVGRERYRLHSPMKNVPMITFIFRRKTSTAFSIENLFDALYSRLATCGESIRRLELPHISTGVPSVLRNAWFVRRRCRAGIMHITGDVHYAALLCPRSKTIITIHDCVVLKRGKGLKRLVLWTLWFWLPLRLASVVTVISDETKRELLNVVAIPSYKIVVIPNFVNPAFKFVQRPFAGALPRILQVGTTSNKNLSKVIAALVGIPCVLVIVGPLSDPTLEELDSSGIRYESHVSIDQDGMVELYRNADIISFPSTYEGFGMPIIEGQAVGRPVLTSDMEPMRSVAGRGGALLVDPTSTASIRDGFLDLIADGSLRAHLIAAGTHNCRRYMLETVMEAYRSLYRQLEAI